MRRSLLMLCLVSCATANAQSSSFEPVPGFHFSQSDALTIHQPPIANRPLTVTGRSGAILGMQDGTIELWQLPTKFFSALHLRAEIDGYPVPIDLNPLAADLEVAPDHTTLTYSHAAITVRQHMFVPASAPDAAGTAAESPGGQVVFEIHAIHPATLIVSLTPAMVEMWPAPQWGQPGWGWHTLGSGGAYEIGTDNPQVFGMIGMPGATAGVLSPYQEHPHTLPIEFRVHYDPAHDDNRYFPLLCEVGRPGEVNNAAGMAALQRRMLATDQALPQMYAETQAFYAHYFDHRTVVHTPDPQFDKAMQWAELAIETSQATIPPAGGKPAETGLVAGWFPSFDSARPGFGWFFGRDTLWSMYAIDSYGDRALARRAFEFLMARQRSDGKMPHEFSQTAEQLGGDMAWNTLPYEYAAADATPLFLLAIEDYVRTTGNTTFLQQHWDAVFRAYRFERTHDTDGDGVYDNSQGTGWVEDWPSQPHQELYLAALDRDAMHAMHKLALFAGHAEIAAEAEAAAAQVQRVVTAYQQPDHLYAFSKNANGTFDTTQTIYPAVAFWSQAEGLPTPAAQLEAWSSHLFSTDWGTRALASNDAAYDPISYHRGTVWPLFTGWTATALYRTGHPLAAYSALRQNLDLTWAQDPGAVTELLSGQFYEALGRSSTHQMWSSAMVLAPALRQLFGVEPDALHQAIALHPHLPPQWTEATLEHVHVGSTEYTLRFHREGASLRITASSAEATTLCLRAEAATPAMSKPCSGAPAVAHELALALPPLEISLATTGLPSPGAETAMPHVLREAYGAHSTDLLLEAPAGSRVSFALRQNGPAARTAHTQDGDVRDSSLVVTMPAGTGWVQKEVHLRW